MDPLKHLKDMLTHRKNQLEKQARRLSRMACASHDPRERRSLRDESKTLSNRAKAVQAQYDKLFPSPERANNPHLKAKLI